MDNNYPDYKKDFIEYISSKKISPSIIKRFTSDFSNFYKENTKSFSIFWERIKEWNYSPFESINELNSFINEKTDAQKTIEFISEWSHSYLGPGELMMLIVNKDSYTGGKKKPDLLFTTGNDMIEVKSYVSNFRISEATSFFTDFGTIIQALTQGGFLTSFTDISNSELKKSMVHFINAFTSERGYIELNSKIWKLEYSDDERMVFKASPKTSKQTAKYSIVRNSLRNWLGRGILSLKLLSIIDPTRKTEIKKKELTDYIDSLLGNKNEIPIPLEQYFMLTKINSLIVYHRNYKESPYRIYELNDLKKFQLDRMGQGKLSYKILD